MITVSDYFKAYEGHPEITPEFQANAKDLLAKVDKLLAVAGRYGWEPTTNPSTGNWISGQKNGGWRPQDCPIGASKSTHKQAQGIDIADPHGRLDKWLLTDAGLDALVEIGLWIEHPGWTDGWCHLQSTPPGSSPRVRVYIPSSAPPQTLAYGKSPVYREVA